MAEAAGVRAGRNVVEWTERRLTGPGLPDLEWMETRTGPSDAAPLLFVHGAFAGAWCWREHFGGFFAERGRPAAAVSLRGHGGSRGGRALRRAGLADLVADVERAVAAMPRPPVLVAHSLGGYLAQLLLGRVALRGLVLMSSLPPDGMAIVGPQVACLEPGLWLEAALATAADVPAAIRHANLQLLFGEGVSPERVRAYAARMVPEAPNALLEAHWLRPVMPAPWADVPTLVVAGMGDRLVRPDNAWRSALYHGAELAVVEGGHFLMLDPGHRAVARRLMDWLEARRL